MSKYAAQLLQVQKETTRNLTESLEIWNKQLAVYAERLRATTSKQYTTQEQLNLGIGELELLYSEVGINDEELEDFDRDTNILLETLEEKQRIVLSGNHFQKFFKEWADLKGDVELKLITLKGRAVTQFSNENELMREWEKKSMMIDDLLKIIVDVMKFSEEPATLSNYDDYLRRFDDLEAKVNTHTDIIDRNLVEFKDLHEKQLKMHDNRNKVKNNGEMIIIKKNNLLEKLVEAKKNVLAAVEMVKNQQQNEEDIRLELKKWQKILDDNNATLDKCDVNRLATLSDTSKAIEILEELLAKIGTEDPSLRVFENSSSEIVPKLEPNAAADLAPVLKNFFKNWDNCESKAQERLNGLRRQSVNFERNENSVMAEWKEKVAKTMTWLDNAITEITSYSTLPKEPFDLPNYLLKFQEVMSKINTRLEFLKDQKDYGAFLLNTNQLQKQADKNVVRDDIKDISDKEVLLEKQLKTAHTLLDILRDRLTVSTETARNIEESVVKEWQLLLDSYTNRLDKIDAAYDKGENDIQKSIALYTALLSDVDSHEKALDKFKDNSALVIETLNTEQKSKANAICQQFFKNWNFNWSNIKEKLKLMEIKARDDLKASEKMAAEWQISSKFINNWLDKAEEDTDVHVKSEKVPKELADTHHMRAEEFFISETTPRELVERLEEEGKEVNEQIDHYLKVATEGIYKGFEDVLDYQGRKIILDNKLLQTSLMLDEVDADVKEVEEVRKTLASWSEELRAKTTSLEDIKRQSNKQDALKRLTELIAEHEIKSAPVSKFVISASQTLAKTPFFKKPTNELKDDIRKFHTEWKKLLQLLLDAKGKLEANLDEEQKIMAEWHQRVVVTEEVFKVETEIIVFAEIPVKLDDYEDYLAKFEDLESKVLDSFSVVDDTIRQGPKVSDKVNEQQNKDKIKEDVDNFKDKKTTMQRNLLKARKTVVEVVEKKKKQKEYEEELSLGLEKWRKLLDDWTGTLNECTLERLSNVMETKIVISTLESLLNEVNQHDNKLDVFHNRAEQLLAALDAETSSPLKVEVKLFVNRYQNLKDKIIERLTVFKNNLNVQMNQHQSSENTIMEEWTPSVIRTLAWLKEAERECSAFTTKPENHVDTFKFLAEFEGLVGKINAKLDYIKEQKDHGRQLVSKAKEQVNKDKVSNDIVMIEEGEKKLQITLSSAKTLTENLSLRLTIAKEIQRNLEESLIEYNEILLGYLNRYEDLNEKYDDEVNDIAKTITLLKELLSEFNGRDEQLHLYSKTTQVLLMKIDNDVAKKLDAGIQTFFANWKLRYSNYKKKLEGLESKVKKEHGKEEQAMEDWLSLSSQVEKWLTKAETELAVYTVENLREKDEDEKMSFHKLRNNSFYLSETVDKKMVKQLFAEGTVIDEQLKRCSLFLKDGSIQKAVNITSITNTINTFMERKETIDFKLTHGKFLLEELAEQVTQDDLIKTTFSDHQNYLSNKRDEFEDIKTMNLTDFNSAILSIEVMIIDVTKRSIEMDSFISNSTNTLYNNKYRKLESHELQKKLKSFLVEWREFEETLKLEKVKFEERISMMVVEEEMIMVQDDVSVEVFAENDDFDSYFANVEAENEEKLNFDLSEWLKILQKNNDTLSSCEIKKDYTVELTERGIATLEILVREIESKDDALMNFETTAEELLKTLQLDKVSDISKQLKSFFKKWYQCTDTAVERLNGLRLHFQQFQRNETMKDDEIKHILNSWQQYLKTKKEDFATITQSTDIDVVVQDLKVLTTELNVKTIDVKSFVNSSSHSVALKGDLEKFVKNWDKFVESVLKAYEKLNKDLQEQLNNDDRLMKEWSHKRVATEEEIVRVSAEVRPYTDTKSIHDYDSYFKSFTEVERKVQSCITTVDQTINVGKSLMDIKLKRKENINNVRNDVDNLYQKKTNLLQLLTDSKRIVSGLSDRQRDQQGSELKFTNSLRDWQVVLDSHVDTYNKCDIDKVLTIKDTETAITILETLLNKMNGKSNDLMQFDANSQKLLSTLDIATANSLTTELKLFFKAWDHCKDKTEERLHSLRLQLSQLLKNEDRVMGEWNSGVERTLKWLSETEAEASVATTESLYEKVHARSEHIRDQISHGEHLISSTIIQIDVNVQKINSDILKIRQKEEALLLLVDNSKTLRRERSRQDEEDESKVMEKWIELSKEIADWLEKAEREIHVYVRDDDLTGISTSEKTYFHLTAFNFQISEKVERTLVERLIEEGVSINAKLKHGTLLIDDGNVKSAENRHRIQKDVLQYTERKTILTDKLTQSKIVLDEIRAQNIKDDEIAGTLKRWSEFVKDKQDALKELNRSGDKHDANLKATLQQIESLFGEFTSKMVEVESFVTISCEIVISNNYDRQRSNTLHEQLQQLLTQLNIVKKNLHESKDRWQHSIKTLFEYETRLLNDWDEKVVTTMNLFSECEDISIYCKAPINVEDFDAYLARFDELQSKISTCGDHVDEMVNLGTGLIKNKLKIDENKERVQKDINTFTHKKTSFLRDLVTANKIVIQLVEHRRIQRENEERFTRTVTEWSNIVETNNQSLHKCNINETITILQTETSIEMLENLLSDIEHHGSRLATVESELHELLETLESTNVYSLRIQLSTLLLKWDRCKEKTTERLAGLKFQRNHLYLIEKNNFEEWKITFNRTMAWLEEMEKESFSYTTLPQEGIDMKAFIENFKNASIKVEAKVEQVKDVKEYGSNLLVQHKIQLAEKRNQVDADIVVLVEKLNNVQQNLTKAKKLVQKRSKVEKETEEKIMSEWVKISKYITTWLDKTEKAFEVEIKGDLQHLERGYSFIARVEKEREGIVEQLREGSSYADHVNLKTAELREGILKDVQTYTNRKFTIDQRTVQNRIFLDAVKVEKDRLSEMMEKLSQVWRAFLHTKKTDYNNELNKNENDANITLKIIEAILTEMKMKREEFDTSMTSSEVELSSYKYSSAMVSSVRKEFQQVDREWKTLVDAVHQSAESLRRRIENELRYEERMMAEWDEKAQVTEELLTSIEEIHQYAAAPNTIDDFDDFFAKFEEIEVKVQNHDDNVGRNLNQGAELHVNKLKFQENKAKVQGAVDVFTQRHSNAKQTVAVAKRMVTDLVAKRRLQKETEDRIRERLSTWQSTLDECNETLGRCEAQEDPDISHTQKCIDILESLVSDMERKDVKVEEFDSWTHQQMTILETSQVTSLTQELKVFVSKWGRCVDKAAERLAGFKMQLVQLMKVERNLMAEWTTAVDKIMVWFKDTEELIRQMDQIDDHHLFLVKFEELDKSVKVKVEYIKEQRLQGDNLIDSAKLQLKEHKTKVIDDISRMGKRLNSLLESLSGVRIRADEFRDRLSSDRDHHDRKFSDWQALLDGYVSRFDEYNEHYNKGSNDIHTTIALLKKLLSEVNVHDTELEMFKQSTLQVKMASRDADQATMMKNLFFKNWSFNKNNIIERLRTLEEKMRGEKDSEEETMSEWFTISKHISSWLSKAENEVSFYIREDINTLSRTDVLLYHQVSEKMYICETVEEKLVENLSKEELMINDKIRQGESLIQGNSRLKLSENKCTIRDEIKLYKERKQRIDEKLMHAKKLIADVKDQTKEDGEIKNELNVWNKRLEEKRKQVNKIKTEDLKSALNHIQVILETMKEEDEEVEEFVNPSEEHLKSNTFRRSKSTALQKEVSVFQAEWNKLWNTAAGLEKNILDKMSNQHDAEEKRMVEWRENVRDVIEVWLVKYERETEHLTNSSQHGINVERFAEQLEKLISVFSSEEVGIDDKLKQSSHLADSEKLTLEKNKQEIRSYVSDVIARKLALNRRMIVAQKWLTPTRDRLKSVETEELSAWFSDANAFKDILRAYESVGREETVRTVKEGEFAQQRQKLLVAELDEHQPTIDDLLKRGGELLSDKSISQAKQSEVSHEMKIIEQRWNALKHRIKDVLDSYEKTIISIRSTSVEKTSGMLTRVLAFNDWLTFAKTQLHTGSQPTTFNEHIRREAGLRMLSSDLEARAREYEYLLKVLTELTPDTLGVLSDHDKQLNKALQKLNMEWDTLIEMVHHEFKILYESLKVLFEAHRAEIKKSLEMIQINLRLIVVDKVKDRKELREETHKLFELNQELLKLKGAVNELSQHTTTLSDVTVFTGELSDKEVLVQFTNDLLIQYEHLVKEVAHITNTFRLMIVEYFCTECVATNHKVEEYRVQLPTYSTEEEDLNVLKELLLQTKHIREEVQSEQFLVDDLELFAEDISQKSVLTSENQITIAENINAVLKAFNHLRHQCDATWNRMYAVAIHIFHHHLHRITEELQRVKTEAHKKMKELSSVSEFSEAIDTQLFAQKLGQREKDLSTQITLVTEQVNQWISVQLIEAIDAQRLKEKDTRCVTESLTVSKDVENLINRVEDEIRAIGLKRVGTFWEWLPTVQKRCEDVDVVGPEGNAVAKQIQEMKLLQAQTIDMSFSHLLDPSKSDSILTFLTEEETINLKSANDEWFKIKDLVDKRLDMMTKAEEYWDIFKARKLDLVEYLREVEQELKAIIGTDLNNPEDVKQRSAECLNVTGAMNARKDHITRLTDTANKLLNLLTTADNKIDGQITLPNSIRSQVADILDSWNAMVKRSIELKSKLHGCVKKYESCKSLYVEVRDWVNECVELLDRFVDDKAGEHIDTLRVELTNKHSEEDFFSKKMDQLNSLEGDLSRDAEVRPIYTLPGNVEVLNNDFKDTLEKLDELKKFGGKVKMLSRRARGGTNKLSRNISSNISAKLEGKNNAVNGTS